MGLVKILSKIGLIPSFLVKEDQPIVRSPQSQREVIECNTHSNFNYNYDYDFRDHDYPPCTLYPEPKFWEKPSRMY